MFNSKKEGFTLAETLIVIAIIGVISVLTLPNVMGNYKKKTYVAQLQKAYNQISQALQQYMVDNDADSLTDTNLNTSDGVNAFLKKYFKTTKICSTNSETKKDDEGNDQTTRSNGCLAASYKSLDGTNTGAAPIQSDTVCAILNTGAIICLTPLDTKDLSVGKADLFIDVNGMNGPNTAGRDFFATLLYGDTKISDSYSGGSKSFKCSDKKDELYGAGCMEKLMEDGWKMDY